MLPLSEMSRNNDADVAAAALSQREGIGLASAMMLLDVTNVTPAAHRQPSCKQATPVIGRRLEIVDARFIGDRATRDGLGNDHAPPLIILVGATPMSHPPLSCSRVLGKSHVFASKQMTRKKCTSPAKAALWKMSLTSLCPAPGGNLGSGFVVGRPADLQVHLGYTEQQPRTGLSDVWHPP